MRRIFIRKWFSYFRNFSNELMTSKDIFNPNFGAKSEFFVAPFSKKARLSTESRMKRGALVVFEGCDHSGKTTQCNKLVAALEKNGQKVELFRFPDRTTTIGKMIDSYLSNKCEIENHAIHLLFSANRWERVPKMLDLLNNGTTLVVDRYAFSGVAFTAAKEGFSMEWCRQPDVGLPKPDIVCYLTLNLEAAAKRATFGGERYERTDFQKKVASNFENLKESYWKEIDADRSIDDLHTDILQIVTSVIDSSKDKPLEKLWTDELINSSANSN